MAEKLRGSPAADNVLKGTMSANGTLNATMSASGTLKATARTEGVLTGHLTTSLTNDSKVKEIVQAILEESNIKSAKIGIVNLPASEWTGDNNLYSQIVYIDGVTEHSQVDLTPDIEQLVIFYEKDLTFVTENDGGVVTVYAIGQKPTNDYAIQVTITEVSV